MKNVKYLVALFATLIVVAFVIMACNKEKEKNIIDIAEQTRETEVSDELNCDDEVFELYDISEFSDIGWAPYGTDFYYERDKMIVEAPQGWVYVGYVNDKLYMSSGSKTSVSCTCNTNGECLPGKITFMGYTFYGCYGKCSNCTMEQSEDPQPDVKGGGFINMNLKPFIASNPDGVLPMAFDAMFEIPQVKAMLEEFLYAFYPQNDYPQFKMIDDSTIGLPEGYKFVPLNLCGRYLAVAIPESEMSKTMLVSGSSEVTCTCTKGKCSPKKFGPAVSCRGNCTGTCTLHDNSAYPSVVFEITAFNH